MQGAALRAMVVGAMKRRKMSLRAAAAEANLSPATFHRIAKGSDPSLRDLVRLCHWLGVSPNQALSFETETEIRPAFVSPKGITKWDIAGVLVGLLTADERRAVYQVMGSGGGYAADDQASTLIDTILNTIRDRGQ